MTETVITSTSWEACDYHKVAPDPLINNCGFKLPLTEPLEIGCFECHANFQAAWGAMFGTPEFEGAIFGEPVTVQYDASKGYYDVIEMEGKK